MRGEWRAEEQSEEQVEEGERGTEASKLAGVYVKSKDSGAMGRAESSIVQSENTSLGSFCSSGQDSGLDTLGEMSYCISLFRSGRKVWWASGTGTEGQEVGAGTCKPSEGKGSLLLASCDGK